MWPFKKHLSLDDLNDDNDMWSVLQGTTENGPMLVRMNTSAKRWAKHPSLAIRVGFAIPLNHPNSNGFPAADENAALNEIETRILDDLRASGPAVHVLTITTGTFKEFVFYIQNGDSLKTIHEKLIADTPSHEVQCMAVHDPEWDVYASFSE